MGLSLLLTLLWPVCLSQEGHASDSAVEREEWVRWLTREGVQRRLKDLRLKRAEAKEREVRAWSPND